MAVRNPVSNSVSNSGDVVASPVNVLPEKSRERHGRLTNDKSAEKTENQAS